MKILHLSSEYPPAKIYGLGRFVHGLARAQAALGDEVIVLTNSSGGAEDDVVLDGVHVHRIEFPNPPRPADGQGEVLQFNHGLVARFFDRRDAFEGVDVVASHDWLTALAAREIARELDAPLVVTFHDEVIGKHFGNLDHEARFVRDLEALTAHDATRVIANSQFIAHEVTHHYGLPEARVTAIPGGIDPRLLRVHAERHLEDFRSALADPEETLVTYVGRLDSEKGLEVLAEAALIASKERPRLRFAFAGTGREEGPLRQRLAPLGSRARFLGYLHNEALSLLYRSSDMVVVPSLYEPFGLVALEAMLAGATPVVSAAGGLREIVRHEEDGLVVPPGDPEALAAAVVRLADDETLRARFQVSAQERARTFFSWERIAERTRAVYEESLPEKRPMSVVAPPEPARPLVSALVLTKGAPARIEACLGSLLARTDYPNLEVVLVDQGSEPSGHLDHLTRELARSGPRIRVTRSTLDEVAREATGQYVCVLDDGTSVPEESRGWLRGLVWLLESMGATTVSPGTTGEKSGPRRTGAKNESCYLARRSYFEGVGTEDGHWVHPVVLRHASASTTFEASVVLVAYNNLGYTRDAIDAVLAHTKTPIELVLVDNGSSDGTREYFQEVAGRVPSQVIENPENLGYPKAANQGLRAARGRHVVLLNNDTQVRPGWLEALLEAARSTDRVGAVTAKILNLDGSVQNAGGILHHTDGSFTIPHANEDRLAGAVSERREVENAGGPCLLVTRELIDQVGIFDEAYSPGYFEDSDLCFRARDAGLRLLYEPEAEVLHHGKATAHVVAREGKLDVWGGFERNKRRFYDRWRESLTRDDAKRAQGSLPAPSPRSSGSYPKRRWLFFVGPEAKTVSRSTYAEQLAAALADRGHDVVVRRQKARTLPGLGSQELSTGPLPAARDANNQALETSATLQASFEQLAQEAGPFDVIVGEGALGALVAQPTARRRSIPFVLALSDCEVTKRANHLTREQLYVAELEHWAVDRAQVVVVPWRDTEEAVRRHYRAERILAVAVPSPSLDRRPEAHRLLRRLGLEEVAYSVFLAGDLGDTDKAGVLEGVPEAAVLLSAKDVWLKTPRKEAVLVSREPAIGSVLAALLRGARSVAPLIPCDPRVEEAVALGASLQGAASRRGEHGVEALEEALQALVKEPELVHAVQ